MKRLLRFIALLCAAALILPMAPVHAVYSQARTITAGAPLKTIVNVGKTVEYGFNPSVGDTYTVSSSGTADTFLEVCDENYRLLASDDDSGRDGNFSLVFPFAQGNSYYIRVSVHSAETETFYVSVERNNQAVFSGRAGAGVNWSLNAVSGLMTVTGTGKISDYSIDNPAPWSKYRNFIKAVSIGSQVRGVGDYAFFYCRNLTYVAGGSGVLTVGDHGFARSGVTGIGTMTNITSLGSKAFSYCKGLEGVELSRAAAIGESCFEHCTALKEGSFGPELAEIGDYAFNGCTALKNLTLSGTDTVIGEYAFSGSGVIAPQLTGAADIGRGAFYGCKSMEEIVIPATVKNVGKRAFLSCSNLEKVIFNGSAPKVTGAGSDDRSFDTAAEMTYYNGRSGWSGNWQGYSVTGDRRVGDLNNDGKVNNADLILLSRAIVSLYSVPYNMSGASDFNGDGNLTNTDIIMMARHIVKL